MRPEHPLVKHREYIIRLLAEGKNYAQISIIFKQSNFIISRFAICRWCSRNGLRLQIPIKLAKKIHGIPKLGSSRPPHQPRSIRTITKRSIRFADECDVITLHEERQYTIRVEDYPFRIPFIIAGREHCSYPLWDDSQRIGDVCGSHVRHGDVYCEACKLVVYDSNASTEIRIDE